MMENIKILKDAISIWQKQYKNYGDYSVTTLLKPPRIVMLEKRHGLEAERSIKSVVGAFLGTGIHAVFERNLRLMAVLDDKYELERSVYDKINGRLIAGRFDILYDGKELWDIKTCQTWKKIFDPNMDEWHQQLNIYSYLLHRRGIDVDSLNVLAVYKDWRKMMALRDRNYPQEQVVEYQLAKWPLEMQETFLYDRIEVMKQCEDLPDEELPECTREDMWAKPTKYAVMKNKKAKRATRVYDTMEEAETHAATKGGFVEIRRGERTRCDTYCSINQFCSQYGGGDNGP
jgi:hypothetical protein